MSLSDANLRLKFTSEGSYKHSPNSDDRDSASQGVNYSPEHHVPVLSMDISSSASAHSSRDVVVEETCRSLFRSAAAELIGSALFIFISCGSAMTTVKYQTVGNTTIGIALTFGFTIFSIAYAIGHISGQLPHLQQPQVAFAVAAANCST